MITDDGGAVGLAEDPASLRRWLVAGPEVSRLLHELDFVVGKTVYIRHEQHIAYQNMFRNDTCAKFIFRNYELSHSNRQ